MKSISLALKKQFIVYGIIHEETFFLLHLSLRNLILKFIMDSINVGEGDSCENILQSLIFVSL